MLNRILEKIAGIAYRHYGKVLLGALLITAVALVFVSKLKISKDIASLLPENTESVRVLRETSKRIGTTGYLMVVVEGEDINQMKLFAEDFSKNLLMERDRLRRQGKEYFVRFVDYKNPIKFFEDRFLLYISLDDLRRIRDRIRDRIKEEKLKSNPFYVDLDEDEEESGSKAGKKKDEDDLISDFSFEKLKKRYKARYNVKGFSEWYIYDKKNQKILSILVAPTKPSSNLGFDDELLAFVDGVAKRVLATGKYPKVKSVELGGSYRNKRQQKESVKRDLIRSALTSFILLIIVITVYFRRLRAVLLIMTPLLLGIVWTLAIAQIRFTRLNMITAFISAVLLGLGIDFGIHLLSRYLEERRKGNTDIPDALSNMLVRTGRATWIGAITTAAAFFALTIAEFKGFSEFGFLAGFGVLSCLSAMITVLPALIVLSERIRPIVPAGSGVGSYAKTTSSNVSKLGVLSKLIPRSYPFPRIVLTIMLLAFLYSMGHLLWSAHCERDDWCDPYHRCCPQVQACCDKPSSKKCRKTRVCRNHPDWCCPKTASDCCEPTLQFEYNFNKLRDKKPIGKKITKKYSKSFKLSLQPVYVLADEIRDVRPIADEIERRRKTNPDTTIDTVRSIYTWIPDHQNEKQRILAEIAELIEPDKISFLDESTRKRIDELRHYLTVPNITLYQLPEKILRWHSVVRPGFEPILYVIKRLLGNLPEGASEREWLEQVRMRAQSMSDEELKEALSILRSDKDSWILEHSKGIETVPDSAPKEAKIDELAHRLKLYNDRNIGIVVRIYTRVDTFKAKAAMAFADEVRNIVVNGRRYVPAGEAMIYADTLRAMERDSVVGIVASALALLLILLIDTRNLKDLLIVISPLTVGIVVMLGIMATFGIRINFYNMIVIPSIIGIGIDNGVHIFYRYKEAGRRNPWFAFRATFGAITLASLTTIIGFSGMLSANNRGLISIGELAILGISSCYVAAITVLPAILELMEEKKASQ